VTTTPNPGDACQNPAPIKPRAIQRAEAVERQQAEREEAERLDRAEMRRNVSMLVAQQHAISNGLPWSPTRPFEHWPRGDAFVQMAFDRQDAEDAKAERRALIDAGLLHLLPPDVHVTAPPSAPAVSRSSSAAPALHRGPPQPRSTSNIRERIAAFFRRYPHVGVDTQRSAPPPPSQCVCNVCLGLEPEAPELPGHGPQFVAASVSNHDDGTTSAPPMRGSWLTHQEMRR
jgi:hypothetical protein